MTHRTPFRFVGAHAVVTGAASGIGRALAEALASRGTHLALVDRDADGLDAVRSHVLAAHPSLTVSVHVVDLAEHSDYSGLVAEVRARHPRVSLLINNAGVALGGRFDQVSLDDFDWVMSVNFRAVVALTKAFLPALLERPGGHLVNVSSLFGLIAPAGQAAYASSKFAVRGFTEALRGELEPQGLGVTVVHPGGIATNISANARIGSLVDPAARDAGRASMGRLLTMPPAHAATLILTAVEHRRPRLVISSQARVADLLARLLPSGHVALVNRTLRRASS